MVLRDDLGPVLGRKQQSFLKTGNLSGLMKQKVERGHGILVIFDENHPIEVLLIGRLLGVCILLYQRLHPHGAEVERVSKQ